MARNTNPEMKQLLGLLQNVAMRLDNLEAPKQKSVMTAEPPPSVAKTNGKPEKPEMPEPINPKSKKIALADRIKHVLAHKVLNTRALASAVDEKPEALKAELAALHASGKVVNIGMADIQRWFWRPSPGVTHREIIPIFVRLLKYQPMTLEELRYALGIDRVPADKALTEVRRSGLAIKITSRGEKNHRYYIEPKHMRDGGLKPRWKNGKAHSSIQGAVASGDFDFEGDDED